MSGYQDYYPIYAAHQPQPSSAKPSSAYRHHHYPPHHHPPHPFIHHPPHPQFHHQQQQNGSIGGGAGIIYAPSSFASRLPPPPSASSVAMLGSGVGGGSHYASGLGYGIYASNNKGGSSSFKASSPNGHAQSNHQMLARHSHQQQQHRTSSSASPASTNGGTSRGSSAQQSQHYQSAGVVDVVVVGKHKSNTTTTFKSGSCGHSPVIAGGCDGVGDAATTSNPGTPIYASSSPSSTTATAPQQHGSSSSSNNKRNPPLHNNSSGYSSGSCYGSDSPDHVDANGVSGTAAEHHGHYAAYNNKNGDGSQCCTNNNTPVSSCHNKNGVRCMKSSSSATNVFGSTIGGHYQSPSDLLQRWQMQKQHKQQQHRTSIDDDNAEKKQSSKSFSHLPTSHSSSSVNGIGGDTESEKDTIYAVQHRSVIDQLSKSINGGCPLRGSKQFLVVEEAALSELMDDDAADEDDDEERSAASYSISAVQNEEFILRKHNQFALNNASVFGAKPKNNFERSSAVGGDSMNYHLSNGQQCFVGQQQQNGVGAYDHEPLVGAHRGAIVVASDPFTITTEASARTTAALSERRTLSSGTETAAGGNAPPRSSHGGYSGGAASKLVRRKSSVATSEKSSHSSSEFSGGKATLSRRAQKFAQKAQQKLSSELSHSASAIYQLFTATESSIYGPVGVGEFRQKSSSGSTTTMNGAGVGKRVVDGAASVDVFQEFFDSPIEHQVFLDVTGVVSEHTSRGVDFMERYGKFLTERALIEEEYAAKLRRLVKNSRKNKTDEENSEQKSYSYLAAFNVMLGELDSLAAQHEVVGDRLRHEIVPHLQDKCQHLRSGRKRCLNEYQQLRNNMEGRVSELNKQYKAYDKAFLDAQNAYLKYDKADKNEHITKYEVGKAKQNAHNKCDLCERAKQGYATEVNKTNAAKHDYHQVFLPQLLEDMRRLDVERIDSTRAAMVATVEAETGVAHLIQRCYADMSKAIEKINSISDTRLLVEQNKTGYAHPQDFEFQDLGDPAAILQHQHGESFHNTNHFDGTMMKKGGGSSNNSSSSLQNGSGAGHGSKVVRKSSMHQRIFGAVGGGGGAISGSKGAGNASLNGSSNGNGSQTSCSEYGHLPPQQRCRKIQQKLDDLAQKMSTMEKTKEGLERMHATYTQTPKYGDPKKAMAELVEIRRTIDLLQVDMSRLRELLAHAQSDLGAPLGGTNNQGLGATGSSSHSQASSPRSSAGGGGKTNSATMMLHRTSSASGHSDNSSMGGGAVVDSFAVGGRKPNGVTTVSVGGGGTHPHNQSVDMGDFYEDCDDEPSAAGSAGGEDGHYAYDGANDESAGGAGGGDGGATTVAMEEGDQLVLLERDVGDGWTRNREGFVPSTWIQCTWYGFTSAN